MCSPPQVVSDYQLLSSSTTPPTESDCFAVGRRWFTPTSMENSYNLPPLYALGDEGQGVTIAIIDSFGNPNMASDLANFDTQFGVQHMCGEPGAPCGAGIPTFTHLYWNGQTEVESPPPNSNGTGLQNHDAWALETSLDVEWAHAMAPEANILNVTTNPAETQGVQGFPTMMNAEQFIVDNHQATVISQSFGAVDPPTNCQVTPAEREIGWVDAGGGFSHVFAAPSYQSTLPAGSTPIGTMRGVPDVAFQASSRTGPLVYDTAEPGGGGWFIVGGTSCSAPQFSGLVAIADQIAGHGLGQINPTLYKLAASSAHSSDFYDVTTGNNQTNPSVPGYPATTGWDPVTGLGTPNAANLVPDLAAG